MADVFISYSYKDREFVERLRQALAHEGFEVWNEDDGIPDSAHVTQAILDGIAQTDSFVLVVSPDSKVSTYVQEEVAYADELKKRFVPVLYRESNWKEITGPAHHIKGFELNEDNFQAGLLRLLKCLKTDLGWFRFYTTLVVRAKYWDKTGRKALLTLEAAELFQAEDWLKSGKEVSELILQFIETNRKAFDRQQKTIWDGQAGEKLYEAQSLLMRGPNFIERAALLAADAAELSQSRLAEEVLRSCLCVLPRLVAELPHTRPVQRMAFSADSKLLCTEAGRKVKSEEFSTHLWDVQSATETTSTDAATIVFNKPGTSPDKSLRAVYDSDNQTLRVVESASDQLKLELSDVYARHEREWDFIRFSRDSKMIAVTQKDQVSTWVISSGKQNFHVSLSALSEGHVSRPEISGLALSPTGVAIAIAVGEAVHILSLESGREVVILRQDSTIASLEFDPSGSRIAVGCDNGCCRVWTLDGREISRISHRFPVQAMVFDPSAVFLATAAHIVYEIDDTVRVWEVESGRGVEFKPVAEGIDHCTFCRNGEAALIVSGRRVALLNLNTRKQVVFDAPSVINEAFDLEDDRHVCLFSEGGLSLWDMQEHRLLWSVPNIESAACSRTHYAVTLKNGSVQIRQIWDGAVVWRCPPSLVRDELAAKVLAMMGGDRTLPAGPYAFAPDSRLFVIHTKDPETISFIDSYTGEIVRQEAREEEEVMTKFVWSSDSRLAGAASPTPFARRVHASLVNVISHERPGSSKRRIGIFVFDLQLGTSAAFDSDLPCSCLAFCADGLYAAAGSANGTIYLWNLESATCKLTFKHGNGEVRAIEFTHDGSVLATAGSDLTVRIWDRETGNEISRIEPGAVVTKICFSQDDSHLWTYNDQGRLNSWLGPNSSLALAREVRARIRD